MVRTRKRICVSSCREPSSMDAYKTPAYATVTHLSRGKPIHHTKKCRATVAQHSDLKSQPQTRDTWSKFRTVLSTELCCTELPEIPPTIKHTRCLQHSCGGVTIIVVVAWWPSWECSQNRPSDAQHRRVGGQNPFLPSLRKTANNGQNTTLTPL